MTDAPEGYLRNKKGVLEFRNGYYRRDTADEAVWFKNGHGEYFGCTDMVISSGGWRSHFCGKKAKYDPDKNGNPTRCGVHCQAAKDKRKVKSDARYEASRREWAMKAEQEKLRREAVEIIRKIAEGHNDPRSICMDWVSRMDETKEATQ